LFCEVSEGLEGSAKGTLRRIGREVKQTREEDPF